MNGIRFLCRISFASWFPCLRAYGSSLGWDLSFELGLSVEMVLVEPVGYSLAYSINMFLVLSFVYSFVTWELYLVVVLLVTLVGLVIGTGEVYLVELSLGLLLEYLLESPNNGAGLPDTLLGAPLLL